MKKERINSIDSLKGISCLVIAFLWHYLNMQPKGLGMPLQSIFGIYYDYGQYFVELFFMISGFVMTYCYKDKINNGEDFLVYITKRFKHLYPIFFTTLVVMGVMQVLYYSITGSYYVYKVSVWHFILNILCIQTGWLTTDQSFNGPAWCISVEIFLYILFYVSTRMSKRDKNINIIISGIIFTCSTVLVYMGVGDYPIINMFMMRGISCFYGGVLLCELNDWIDTNKKEKIATQLFIGLIVFRITLLFTKNYSFWENEINGRMALILFQWPIILFATINCSLLKKFMEIKPLQFLGKISMDIFLWHVPVQIMIKTIDAIFNLNINYGSVAVWIIYIVMVLVVAMCSNWISIKKQREHYLAKGLVGIVCCILAISITDVLGIQLKDTVSSSLQYSDMSSVITCDAGVTLAEEFYVDKDTNIEKIQFYTITWNRNYSDQQLLQISIIDKESGESVYSIGRWLNYFRDGSIYELTLDNKVTLKGNKWYTIKFETNTVEGQETMALMMTNSTDNQGKAYINDIETNQHISMKIWTRE